VRHWLLVLLLLVMVLIPGQARAQLVVIDPAQVSQNVISLANDALNLLPLPVIEIASTLATDIGLLTQIVQEASQIGMDINSIQAQLNSLFNLETAPVGSSELRQRIAEIESLIWRARAYAARCQALIQTFTTTLQHINMLIGTIAELVGVKQGLQVLNQKAATLNYIAMVQATQLASYHHSEIYDRMQQQLVLVGMKNIHEAIMEDYP